MSDDYDTVYWRLPRRRFAPTLKGWVWLAVAAFGLLFLAFLISVAAWLVL